jgi:hypothetical protein
VLVIIGPNYPTLRASGWVEFLGMSGDTANLREHAIGAGA